MSDEYTRDVKWAMNGARSMEVMIKKGNKLWVNNNPVTLKRFAGIADTINSKNYYLRMEVFRLNTIMAEKDKRLEDLEQFNARLLQNKNING